MRKIMLGHNVTSPLLFGVASTNGFSSNADELQNSFILFNNMIVRPFQDEILEAFDKVLAFNGIALKLFFKTLKPLEFTDLENAQNQDQVAEETGTNLSTDKGYQIAEALIDLGEDVDPDWLLIDEFEVDYDNDDSENELLNSKPKKSILKKAVELVSSGMAFPNSRSEQDEIIDGITFITRYVYEGQDGGKSKSSRPFCQAMRKANKIYRKEDILRMSTQVVNAGLGPEGADTYNIWLYKGGANCYHRWNKQVYVSFKGYGIDVRSPLAKRIAGIKAEIK
jgi:hypothetical protein